MSDDLANDLFGDSDNEAPPPLPVQSATPSRSASPERQESTGIEDKPLLNDDDDAGGDLFGDETKDRSSSGTPESPRSVSQNPLEYPEVDDADGPSTEVRVNLPIPKLPRMKASDGKIWHLKLPAYVNIESKPFEPDYYRETLDEEATTAKDANAAKLRMIGVRNTIRWRWVTGSDGQPTRQSNARMLRWSDGSVSLQLGTELFDVASSSGSSLLRPTDTKPNVSASQSQALQSSSTTFLATAAKAEKVLMTETSIAGQLSLQPTSMKSKTHMELVSHVGQQHVKHSRMKILEDIQDQEKVSALLLQAGRGTNTPPVKSKARNGAKGGRGGVRKARKMGSDTDDDMSDGPRRSSNRSKSGRETFRDDVGVYDEDDGFVVADDDEEDTAEETEDSDEMAYGSSKKSKTKSKSNKSLKKSSKKRKDEEDEEEDEMEAAERRIEMMEREKKRVKKDSGGTDKKKSREFVESEEDAEGEEDMEMDVESE